MKQQRRSFLRELIQEGVITSQQDAVSALHKKGLQVTQATVSRDLQEIGAVRIKENGELRYFLQEDSTSYKAALERVFNEFVIRTSTSANMIIIHTPPGYASVVASAIDKEEIHGVLGVVAGDDTLFICCDEEEGAQKTLKRIEKVAFER
jgi:transcriptional regulator of arginine metabolism